MSKHGHVSLDGFCGTIVFPQFEAAFEVLESCCPVSTNVALECLPEDRVEFLDVLLKTNNIAIKSEHIINTSVFEVLNVDIFVLGKLNEITYLVILW